MSETAQEKAQKTRAKYVFYASSSKRAAIGMEILTDAVTLDAGYHDVSKRGKNAIREMQKVHKGTAENGQNATAACTMIGIKTPKTGENTA